MRIDKDLATLRLKKRKDFWIEKLKTLHPYGLNAELKISKPIIKNPYICFFGTCSIR